MVSLPSQKVPVIQQAVIQEVEPAKAGTQKLDAAPPLKAPTQVMVSRQIAESPVKPKVLSDNVVGRMAYDPEVRNNKRKLFIGLAAVLSLVILTVLGNQFQWWSAIGNNLAALSQKILVKGNVESREAVVAEATKKTPKENTKTSSVTPAKNNPPAANLSERDQSQSAIAAFLSAKNITERLEYVRDRALVEKMMRDYYERGKDGPIPFEKVEEIEINPEGENTFAYNVSLSSGGTRRMLVAKDGNGKYLVDWASFVLYGEMDWQTFMEKKPQNPVLMRVLVASDNYYAEEFSDKNRYGCLKLTDPGQESSPPIYAYFTSSSTLGRSLNFVLRSSLDQAVPMTLTLKYPSESKVNNQVLIDEMVTQGWVTKGR